jgi:hypothetical protein
MAADLIQQYSKQQSSAALPVATARSTNSSTTTSSSSSSSSSKPLTLSFEQFVPLYSAFLAPECRQQLLSLALRGYMDGSRQQAYAEKEAAAVAAASRQRSLLAVRASRKARLRQQLGRAVTSGEYGKHQQCCSMCNVYHTSICCTSSGAV